ncbi:TPA: YqzE family protein [Yersinia enterocolitica]|nr:YqzE family protein [Yersinia enterocolitica]
MNTNDYVKYLTQTFVQYMDQPKEERQKFDKNVRGAGTVETLVSIYLTSKYASVPETASVYEKC